MTRDIEPHLQGTYRLLMRAARLIQRRQDEALAPLNLTRAAVIALEAIAPRPLNQEQLAAKVHVQSQPSAGYSPDWKQADSSPGPVTRRTVANSTCS